jgi:acetyl-CoA carboxylase carboxyltransferase component
VETTLVAPFAGTVVATPARTDEAVGAGMPVVVIEAMKMEHEVVAEQDAIVAQLAVAVGESVTEAERTATVRHVSRMFTTGANLSVPCGTVVLRKGYGLGAQAMAAGGFKSPLFVVGWPTSEFGAMGLEGAVRLGMRRELEEIDDPVERHRAYERLVAAAYERGRGLSVAAYFEIDDVIDPADTRRWIATLFDEAAPPWWTRPGKRRPNVDTW